MKFQNSFFSDRYGSDNLSVFLTVLALLLLPLYSLISISLVQNIILFLALFFLAISGMRMMSREKEKRARENELFLSLFRKKSAKEKLERRNFKYFRCPECKRKLRVPRGHGKVKIKCPECGESFIRKS